MDPIADFDKVQGYLFGRMMLMKIVGTIQQGHQADMNEEEKQSKGKQGETPQGVPQGVRGGEGFK